jgi:hypothetical protein
MKRYRTEKQKEGGMNTGPMNHAVGVLKDRLIGILITDDRLARKYLYRELYQRYGGG